MLIIKNALILDPSSSNEATQRDLWIDDERIINPLGETPLNAEIIDATGKWLAPALFDLRCWQGGKSISSGKLEMTAQKALAGGFATICLMPDSAPSIDDENNLEHIKLKAEKLKQCDFKFYGAATKGMLSGQLAEILTLNEAGAIGFTDGMKPFSNMELFRMALEYCAITNKTLFSHAEDADLFNDGVTHKSALSTRLGLRGISAECETSAIARQIEVLRSVPKARLHFMHLSIARSVELITRAKNDGLNVSADVAPHQLMFTEEAVGEYNNFAKVNPPLRSLDDQEALIKGLLNGSIDALASDHKPNGKTTEALFVDVPFGCESLERAFSYCLEKLIHTKRISLIELVKLWTTKATKCLNLQKDFSLKPGATADIILIDSAREWVCQNKKKGKGKVIKTIKNGKVVFSL